MRENCKSGLKRAEATGSHPSLRYSTSSINAPFCCLLPTSLGDIHGPVLPPSLSSFRVDQCHPWLTLQPRTPIPSLFGAGLGHPEGRRRPRDRSGLLPAGPETLPDPRPPSRPHPRPPNRPKFVSNPVAS